MSIYIKKKTTVVNELIHNGNSYLCPHKVAPYRVDLVRTYVRMYVRLPYSSKVTKLSNDWNYKSGMPYSSKIRKLSNDTGIVKVVIDTLAIDNRLLKLSTVNRVY